ncbi:hypothetical protein ACFRFL_27225 [Streptomyces sp. NPDC056708]|uniref:hypothetical protein n=1 Tax=unclassified Streptomyces TaxID=2593676 RepID=UPI0036C1952E
MSTFTPYPVEVLQKMQNAAGHTYLDLGTGPGVSLALTAAITRPGWVVDVERDEQMAAFTQNNLDRPGVGAAMEACDAPRPPPPLHRPDTDP